MRAIKINPVEKTIEEVDVKNPNQSLKHFYELIGCELVELVQLDKEIIMVIDENGRLGEIKGAFKFFGCDDLVIAGTAIVLGGNGNRFKTLKENKKSFELIVEWVDPKDVPEPKQSIFFI